MPLAWTSEDATLSDVAETMFPMNERGRLTGDGPQLHILRADKDIVCRVHERTDEAVASALEGLSRRGRGRPRQWAESYADYLRILSAAAPLRSVRAGLLYSFSGLTIASEEAVSIEPSNAHLLARGLDEWIPDVGATSPMMAVLVNGRAVSLCASVRASQTVHCAGVETLPNHRGRGLGGRPVAAWARRVRADGATPIYGTTFDNISSQALAMRLGLNLIGSEFTVECERG